MSTRTATIRRETGETKIEITLDLDGAGAPRSTPASAFWTTC